MRFLLATLLTFSLLISGHASAQMYTTPILSDAEDMLLTAPEKSLAIADRYLEQRRLAKSTNRSHNNNETDRTIRTPLNTVHAYLIVAQANSLLKNRADAFTALDKAKELVAENNLVHTSLEVTFTEALLVWFLNKNADQTLKLLDTVDLALEAEERITENLQVLDFESEFLRSKVMIETATADQIQAQFEIVRQTLAHTQDLQLKVRFQITVGNYHLWQQQYEKALTELLSAFWIASENEYIPLIARANLQLSELYYKRGVGDKALQHANQAAEFYEKFAQRRGLSAAQTLLAKIYQQQNRYNFALVYYFNALDLERELNRNSEKAKLKLAIAQTYLALMHYPLAEQYVLEAITTAQNADTPDTLSRAYALHGELAIAMKQPDLAVAALDHAVSLAEKLNDQQLLGQCLIRLSHAYEAKGNFRQALIIQRRYDALTLSTRNKLQIKEAESFKQQERVIERQLQFDELVRQQMKSDSLLLEQQKINLFLIGSLSIMLVVLILRHRIANTRFEHLKQLRKEFYTHPRSGLRNLRMLNERLSDSLERSNAHFEQWYLGEMIHEPLSDKLRFAMFDVPFLKIVYLQHGYRQALELEKQLGDFFKARITEPARLYHFSDAMFVYIEPNADPDWNPEILAHRIQSLVNEFVEALDGQEPDNRVRLGMAEYPFLPRAFTSINDQELLDILLMATAAARRLSKSDIGSQWVHLSAIDTAPAASFANNNIRQACLDGISSGLVKVKSSSTTEINWQPVHESDKNQSQVIDK